MKYIGNLRDSEGSHANQQMRKLLDRLGTTGTVLRREPFPRDGDCLIQWGFKPTTSLLSCVRQNKPFVILDLGYFDPDRYEQFSVSINGFHGFSMVPRTIDKMSDRPYPPLLPPRETEGEQIVILGQVDGDQSLRGLDFPPWMNRQAIRAHETFRKPVVKRMHPKMLNPWEPKPEPLEDTFELTDRYISYTSTAAVQTCIAGIPTEAHHMSSPAYPVACNAVGDMRLPRDVWAHRLSQRSFYFTSVDELDALAVYLDAAMPEATTLAYVGAYDLPGDS